MTWTNELFDGNIASSMGSLRARLGFAAPRPSRKHVIALDLCAEELDESKVSIEKVKDKKQSPKFTKRYEELRRSLQDAGGVDTAIAKHLKKSDAKIIVFCPNNEELRPLDGPKL